MKRNHLFSFLFVLVLMFSLVPAISPSYAQGGATTHEALLAQIPDLTNFEAQAQQTYVGEVEGSYAYIAFVIQGNLAVIYVCDNIGVYPWITAEVVNGSINVTHEESGVKIVATVTAETITGTVTLAIDDDGTNPEPHNFIVVPAVPGKTGLARFSDDLGVAGWIVLDNGVRGIGKVIKCAGFKRKVETLRNLMNNTASPAVANELAGQIIDTNIDSTIAGCSHY
jgi:hypothetical protein